MQFTVHNTGRLLVLSPKAQIVMSSIDPAAWERIQEFQRLRDEYIRFRDANSINRITQWEIESGGLEAAMRKVSRD